MPFLDKRTLYAQAGKSHYISRFIFVLFILWLFDFIYPENGN